jgi:hypothetical protein
MLSSKDFLRHFVMINYAGKVYTVIRGMELVFSGLESNAVIIYISYIIFMTFGMYWYTMFWLGENLDRFYDVSQLSSHPLHNICGISVKPGVILFSAALYYVVFAVLFFQYENYAFSIWNVWCSVNLIMAIPYGESRF